MNFRTLPSRSFNRAKLAVKPFFWFGVGFLLAAVTLASVIIIYFQHKYDDRVIPNVFVEDVYLGGKTHEEVKAVFDEKNREIAKKSITFTTDDHVATVSAEALEIGYDSELIAEQAINLGKSKNILSSSFIIFNSYINGTFQPASYSFSENNFREALSEIDKDVTIEPVNALFNVENNKVVAFQESRDGRKIDYSKLTEEVKKEARKMVHGEQMSYTLAIPITTVEPEVTTEEANKFGIVEEIGRGKSYFRGSILNRIHNISLAASRVNGILVPPGEIFSFNKNLGDVSRYTGYKEAYVISGGRTVLGDGGGVCQVSTTLFRAMLNAGLPIEERHAHSYRVGYYEQESPMGMDATIYVPSVDLKFKNDTNNHILIQSFVDPSEQSLTFIFYGKSDGRQVEITEPTILSTSAAPEPLYEDDPNLPKGVEQQVDFAAPGATVKFSRTVTRNGEVIIEDTYTSVYTPWRAVFKRGTKEG